MNNMNNSAIGSLPQRKSEGQIRSRDLRKLAVRATLVAVSVVLVGFGVIGWVGSERAIHPKAVGYSRSLADYPDLHPQEISFPSRTHITIRGRFFPGVRTVTLALSHGYGDNQEQMLPYAEFLNRAGYNVLTYDMRNRGHSGGEAVTLGALEQLDLVSAVNYLTTRGDVDPSKIGALGLSLGASTTLLAAAQDPRIKAVVDDSGFSDATEVVASSFEHFVGLSAFPFAAITISISEWRTGVDIKSIRPVDVVARISPRHLFIIHCLGDTIVPLEDSKRTFAAARAPKQVWWVQTGGHIDGHVVEREEYERRVTKFFDAAFR
jgi:fermentation-respiration switch protein FrsA (DUF1100 family)